MLLPAETLLDLYGEDIRARAYVTTDPLRGEMMLRPDFTVPVVQAHMADGADPARYCYMGEVFRKQEHLGNRACEYLQVGFEVFDRAAPEAADAEVFALFAGLVSGLGLRAVTGDIGILMAAVRGLGDDRAAAGGVVAAYLAAKAVPGAARSVCGAGGGVSGAGGVAGAVGGGRAGCVDRGGGQRLSGCARPRILRRGRRL